MRARIVFYSAFCIVLGASAWLVFSHAHRSKSALPPEVSGLAAPSPTRTVAAAKPGVAPASAPSPSVVSRQPVGLSPAIQVIVDDQAGYEQRLAAIDNIRGKLSGADREALYAFLRQKSGLDNVQLEQVLKNKLMDVLCALNPPPPGLFDLLTQIYHDPAQNGVLRDYAVQHVAAFYQQLEMAADVDPQDKSTGLAQARKVLWDALAETDGSIAGTALLALTRLSRENPESFDPRQIAGVAEQMAGPATPGELTRITAIQVCAQLNVQAALPVIQAAVQNGQTMTVRISAMGALGSLGGAEQIPFLNSVLHGDEERLTLSAQHALDQIQN